MANFIRVEDNIYVNLDTVEAIRDRPAYVEVRYSGGVCENFFGESADLIRGYLKTPMSVEELPS